MKSLKIFSFVALFMAIASFSFAQSVKTEKFKVSGNCGMCKSSIEKAAKSAGATDATWDTKSKELTVKYKSTSTNTAKIQEKIAGVGYDNAGMKAPDAAYEKLHSCCKYERTTVDEHEGKCEMKDGKCTDMSKCKHKGCCDANSPEGSGCKGTTCTHEGAGDGKSVPKSQE